jgi:hypothetical protein
MMPPEIRARRHARRWTAAAAVCLGCVYAVVVAGRARSIPGPMHGAGAVPTEGHAHWQSLLLLQPGAAAFGLVGDAALGDDGRSYVLDVMEKRVGVAEEEGAVAWTGRGGQGPGEFFIPVALAADRDQIYVLDRGNQRIERYRSDGGALERTGSLPLEFVPEDLCASDGRLFVLGAHTGHAIHEISPHDGRVLRSFAPDAQLTDDLLATFRAGGYLACAPAGRIAFLPLLRGEVRLFSTATGALLDSAAIPGYHPVLIRKTADAVEFRAPEGGTHDAAAAVIPLADGRMLVQVGGVRPGATMHELTEVRSYLISWEDRSVRPLAGKLPRIASVDDDVALALETVPQPAVNKIRFTLLPAAGS